MHRPLFTLFCVVGLCGSAAADDFATQMMEATFKLFHPNSTGTCFLVRRAAPDATLWLVTAGHVLENTKGDTAFIVLRKSKGEGAYERHDHKIPIRREAKPLWTRHAQQDVAVLKLASELPVPIRPLPEEALADEARLKAAGVHICSPLYVLTYPTRFESNSAGFPIARQGIFASPPLAPLRLHPTFLADFPAFSGDSGGPVFMADAQGRLLVLGLVLARFHHDEKIKMQYEERIVHHALDLGKILHAQYIRETLDQAAKPADPTDLRALPGQAHR